MNNYSNNIYTYLRYIYTFFDNRLIYRLVGAATDNAHKRIWQEYERVNMLIDAMYEPAIDVFMTFPASEQDEKASERCI